MKTVDEVRAGLDASEVGKRMQKRIERLYPICRSITGNGVRETLAQIAEVVPLEVHEVPTGTPVLDWTVPPEWNVAEAWIKDSSGRKVVDFSQSNLHLVSYSVPIHRRMSREELTPHLFSLPDRPGSVPYRTSYYSESWGFCIRHRDLEALDDGFYEVFIDAALADGSLTYGELLLAGARSDEVLISTHVCHPSLANDNLSGIALATALAELLSVANLRHSFRFLFIPGTIGSITWLALNETRVARIKHGLVLAGVGDPGAPTYKRSRRGVAAIDRAAELVLGNRPGAHRLVDFSPYGYDERQFCSPGFDLPVGRFGRTPHGEYPEYHTSADNLTFISPDSLSESLDIVLSMLEVLEGDGTFLNLSPRGEPQLGRRGLYRNVGGDVDAPSFERALLWLLNMGDGSHSLLDVAERSRLPFSVLRQAAGQLVAHGLLERLDA
jgi:aminopeptidase-like protein